MLFLTPDGKVFYSASGFQSASSLLQEMRYALRVYKAMQQQPTHAAAIARKAHVSRLHRLAPLAAADPAPTIKLPSISFNGPFDVSGLQRSAAVKVAKAGASKGPPQIDDLKFGARYPLMPIGTFLKNPRLLVGNGNAHFSSIRK